MTTTVVNSYANSGGYSPMAAGTLVRSSQLRSVTAAIIIDELLAEVEVPAGAKIVGVGYQASDLDSSVSPAFTADIGDASNDDRFVAASTVGQAEGATADSAFVIANRGYQYTAKTKVQLTCKAAPATSATSGNIYFWVDWTA